MSLTEIRNGLWLFSNPVWAGSKTLPSTLVRNLTGLSAQLGHEERITDGLTTLTTNNVDKLKFGGLLFVPDISFSPACDEQQYQFIPRNATRRQNLPTTKYSMIAIAPWFNVECAQAYLRSAGNSTVSGFIFYKYNNYSTKPQEVDSPVWNLDDGGAWKRNNHFPIFAVSGLEGQRMMSLLGLYSGKVNQVPHGDEINQLYGPNPDDYVRIWTELTLKRQTNLPAVWLFVLIVIGALLLIISAVSLTMHFVQRRNRKTLERRVKSGEVDLEAMGIKRLTVPPSHVKTFPIFTYNATPDLITDPPIPSPSGGKHSSHAKKSSRKSRRSEQRSASSDTLSPSAARSARSLRSKRRSITGTGGSTATNYQPKCHICLTSFEHKLTVIRELPCGHIFHPACIDEFLTQISSLCPMCKSCMLPRGYSPKITNSMVRRERAVRRLRERVDVEDSSSSSGDTKLKEWRKHFFSSSGHAAATTTSDVAMTPLPPSRGASSSPLYTDAPSFKDSNASMAALESAGHTSRKDGSRKTMSAKIGRFRKSRPRALRLLPTHQEEVVEAGEEIAAWRLSPSSFARERMREIAATNAPFDDPDHQRPQWRRALSKAFPGFT